MRREDKPVERIENALRLAHRRKDGHRFTPDWRRALMRDIQRLHKGPGERRIAFEEALAFRRIVLPFASAAGTAAIVFLLFSISNLTGFESDFLRLLWEDPTGLFSTQLLGV